MEWMSGNVENYVTFKVKLFDAYHDFVLEWSEESQCYEGQQLFKQLAWITGIPVKYTSDIQIFAGPHPRPAHPILVMNPEAENKQDQSIRSQYRVCNKLAKEVVRCKNQFDCDRFVLIFRMWCAADKHFYIRYELLTQLVVPETECSRVCLSKNTKVMLDKMRSIITNEELNSQLKRFLPDCTDAAQDTDERHKVFMHLNVYQYLWVPCRISPDPHQVHLYLRARG